MPTSMIDESFIPLIDKGLTLLGTAVAGVAAFVVKEAGNKVAKISESIDDHHQRITVLECTYVSKEDLESIIDSLQKDLRCSFERAHNRIDELYRKPGG